MKNAYYNQQNEQKLASLSLSLSLFLPREIQLDITAKLLLILTIAEFELQHRKYLIC